MNEGIRGSHTAEIAGEERTFRLGIGQLEALEKKTGKSPMDLMRLAGSGTLLPSQLVHVLVEGLKGVDDKDSATTKVRQLIDFHGFLPSVRIALGTLSAALLPDTDNENEDDEGNASGPAVN